jgi:hypothetical protein
MTKCNWKYDREKGFWETSCYAYYYYEYDYLEHNFVYCPYCGKWINNQNEED